MNTIRVDFPIDEWVWLCEFLAGTIHELGEDIEAIEDAQHIIDLLELAEKGS